MVSSPLKSVDFTSGAASSASAPTSIGTDWISYTFPRPDARVAQSGNKLLIAKAVTFTCAGYKTSVKAYARVSYADGNPFSNSTSVTLKAQTEAKSAVRFTGVSFPLSSASGGANMRVWLVGGGSFYFDRNTLASGHIVGSGGKRFAGAPTGKVEHAEVPAAPTAVVASHDEDSPDIVSVVWTAPTDTGGVPLSGYRLQWADDTTFSINLHEVALTRTTYRKSGFDPTKVYYFRVAARNEVSDHFGEKGGDWSNIETLSVYSPKQTPADDFGASALPLNYFPAGLTEASAVATPLFTLEYPQRAQDVIRSPDTGEFYWSQGHDAGSSGDQGSTTISDVAIVRCSTSGAKLDSMILVDAGHGAVIALEYISSQVWVWLNWQGSGATGASYDLVRFPYAAGTFNRDTVPNIQTMPKFRAGEADVAFDWQNDQLAYRIPGSTSERYELRKISEYTNGTDKVYAVVTLPIRTTTTMQGYFTYERSLFRWTGTANDSLDVPKLTQYSWVDGTVVAELDCSDLGAPYPGGWYEPEGASLYNTDNTAPFFYLGFTFNPFGSHTYQAFKFPLLTQAQALAGATGTADPGGDDGSDGAGSVVAPVPDTSSTETRKGGLLLSRPARSDTYSVFLTDRGGMRRIGQIGEFTSLKFDRRRSDMSEATLTLSSDQAKAMLPTLNRMAACRSEIVIFRGEQRVWEGPITTVQWGRTSIVITAKDVLWWVSRTIPHDTYSFQYPNIGYSVEFIAGILTAELSRKEALDPPINVLPYLHTYIEDSDAKTTRTVQAGSTTLWQLLDDMATSNGINYTVVGRAIHIWDASRAALGRTRNVTEQDFLGDPYVTEYGTDMATMFTVPDGQGNYATAGAIDDFYGEIELLAQSYGEAPYSLDPHTGKVISTTTSEELLGQAIRNLNGRNPVPTILNVPNNSSLDPTRPGIGLDVLVPGVYVPVQAVLSGRRVAQVQKLDQVVVEVDSQGGEKVSVTMIPASSVVDPTEGDVQAPGGGTVNQTPQPPTARMEYTVSGLTVYFSGASSDPGSGPITTYQWNFGDNAGDAGITTQHTYASGGTYLVTLTATNSFDLQGQVSQQILVAQPSNPVGPTAAFDVTVTDLKVSVDAGRSQPGSTDIATYDWDWGDGGAHDQGSTATHTYAAAGSYTITLTTTDDNALSDTATQSVSVTTPVTPTGWTLVFSDDFSGSAVNAANWTVDNGTTFGSGNNELELNMAANVTVGNSLLNVTAKRQTVTVNGVTRNYTSGHLSSRGKQEFQIGTGNAFRLEVRAKLPDVTHLLPCPAWIRPVDGSGGGEVDSVEATGTTDTDNASNTRISQTVHLSYSPAVQQGGASYLDAANGFTGTGGVTDWRTYAFEVFTDHVAWFVDGKETYRVLSTDPLMTSNAAGVTYTDVFAANRAWFIHITLGVGGNWPGAPTAATIFPAVMAIDYIRVFQQ